MPLYSCVFVQQSQCGVVDGEDRVAVFIYYLRLKVESEVGYGVQRTRAFLANSRVHAEGLSEGRPQLVVEYGRHIRIEWRMFRSHSDRDSQPPDQ